MIGIPELASYSTALLLLSLFSYRLWRNLRFLRYSRELAQPADPLPSVSVLIPARNEARTIVACIESLARQDYSQVEIIALNDQSSDDTGILLDALAVRFPHLTVIHGKETPPAGWNGKSYACHRLAEQATGEWLLFTDADTIHASTSVLQGITQAAGLHTDLLSAFPRQITRTWGERLIVSFILDFLPLVGVDLTALWRGTSGSTASNGQYLLVRATTYRAIGGHQSIAPEIVDDFALARRVRSKGYRIALVDGTSMLSCRMYQSAREVWTGFSKNILLALETASTAPQPWWKAALFAWGYASVFAVPPLELLFAQHRTLPLIALVWLGALRIVVNQRLGRSLTEVLTTPLAAWGVMGLGLSALYRRIRGQSITWKGRDYPLDP